MGERKRGWADCALCGAHKLTTREHVVPRCLYPPSKATSRFQRIVIPACAACNNGTADEDAHFRNVLLLSGETTQAVAEIWEGSVRRAFAQVDGQKRASDLLKMMEAAPEPIEDRYKIYPARDERVLKIIRKVVRGLCYHHKLLSAVDEGRVTADVLKFSVPEYFISEMKYYHAEEDILEYFIYMMPEDSDYHSVWFLKFFERTIFIAIVSR